MTKLFPVFEIILAARGRISSGRSFNEAMLSLRTKRNRLLAETDYLALSDQTLSSDMTTYRQNLRNITNGVDTLEKVNNVTWPTKP